MKLIESIKNDQIKEIKKLHKKKYRELSKQYMIEGEHLIEEALAYRPECIEKVIVTEDSLEKYQTLINQVDDAKLIVTQKEILKYLSELPTPQPIIAIMSKADDYTIDRPTENVLMLDGVQDPGNVGTMIRTADAAGFKRVVVGKGSADIYSSKVVRSMQGSQFHIEIVERDLLTEISELKNKDCRILGTELNEHAVAYRDVPTDKPVVLIMGNEGQGVSRDVLNQTDMNVYIPIKGQAESLNVAIAAGILMFMF